MKEQLVASLSPQGTAELWQAASSKWLALGQPLPSLFWWHSRAHARQRKGRYILYPARLPDPHANIEATDTTALLSATTPQTWHCPGRIFVHLTYPAWGQFLHLILPPATCLQPRHQSQGLTAGWVQVFLLTPNSLEALEAAESWQGGSGVGIHSPSSTTFHPAVREGAASLLSSWTPAQRLGASRSPIPS